MALPESDRFGLVVVLASLLAIVAIVLTLFGNERDRQLEAVRDQGVSLVRTMSAIPWQDFESGAAPRGVMQVLRQTSAENAIAYASVVESDGTVVNEVTANGVIVPAASLPARTPSEWLGERRLELRADGRAIIEFHAPLLLEGELRGFVRLGYFEPQFGPTRSQLPFLAMVALPVFLLVPLFYLLLRLEVRPVRAASEQMGRVLDGEQFRRVEVAATGELGDFMRRFNAFVERSEARVEALQAEQQRLVTSSKLLSYGKRRVETVLETLPEAVLILDETGAVTFANQKFAAMFNVTADTVLSQPPTEWCDHPDVLQLLSKHQPGGRGRVLADTVRFRVDASYERAIASKTYPLFSPKNPSAAIGSLIVFRDETQEALARQARVEFVGHLAHELKSPLNVLGLYSESLLGAQGKDERFRIEAANVISQEVDQLSSLITGLLSMTQIETGSLTPDRSLVRLRDVAGAVLDEAKHAAAGRDIRFEFDAPADLGPVYVDKDLIRIALSNLLSNAVKYNRDGGEVRLIIAETEDALQIRVADTGIGISEEDEAKIFGRFFRSSDDRVQAIGGHGLGLSLARQIVELHSGSLTLNRDRDEGTEFIIVLWKETSAIKQAI